MQGYRFEMVEVDGRKIERIRVSELGEGPE